MAFNLPLYVRSPFSFYYWKNLKITLKPAIIIITAIAIPSILINYHVNFSYSPAEIIHQVASTPELEYNLYQMNTNDKILIKGDLIWPTHTFLMTHTNYKFNANKYTNFNQFDYIFLDSKYAEKWHLKLFKTFQHRLVPFRRYWWPRKKDYNFLPMFKYLFTRKNQSPLTVINADLYTKIR